jgi:pSer/pThr/pTyr-binding forkhead associated (FHA) protein
MAAEEACQLLYTLGGRVVEFELVAGSVVVGRSQDCDLVISDDSVSRRHAELTLEGGSWYIKDLGAKNGTALNERIIVRSRLSNGDQLRLGNFNFTFQSRATGLEISFSEDPTAQGLKLDSISMEEASLMMLGSKESGDDTLMFEANDWIPALMSEAAQSLLASGGVDEMFEVI